MGNSSSSQDPAWSQTYPRPRSQSQPRIPQGAWAMQDQHLQETRINKYHRRGLSPEPQMIKVLPQRFPGQKLRLTENGNILNHGGTISARKLEAQLDVDKRNFKSEPDLREAVPEPMRKPRESPAKQKIKARRKGRAPAPTDETDTTRPRNQILKVQDEINSRSGSESRDRCAVSEERSRASSLSSKRDMQSIALSDNESVVNEPVVSLQKETSFRTKEAKTVSADSGWDQVDSSQLRQRVAVVSSDPAFQIEVRQAVQRKASMKAVEKPQTFYFGQNPGNVEASIVMEDKCIVKAMVNNSKAKTDSLDRNPENRKSAGDEIRKATYPTVFDSKSDIQRHSDSKPELPDNSESEAKKERINSFVNDSQAELWRHKEKLTNPPRVYPTTTESEEEEDTISLHLRPTLPKKQLELPKFSPSAAWRALSDTSTQSYTPPIKSSLLFDDDLRHRSADSGISGDAGSPAPGGEKPLAASSPMFKNWTPEQDLDDNNSIADLDESKSESKSVRRASGASTPPKLLAARTHMFTKNAAWNDNGSSSPAWTRSAKKRNDDIPLQQSTPHKFNSIRKLKRSVSGAVSSVFSSRSSSNQSINTDPPVNNWYLSKSTTNLNQSFDSPANLSSSMPALNGSDQETSLEFGVIPIGISARQTSRIVYLPEYDSRRTTSLNRSPRQEENDIRRAKSADPVYTAATKGEPRPANSVIDLSKGLEQKTQMEQRKSKKFTFKSTLRMNERKMLEEKLNREAEEKERRRVVEAEMMRRVEEDFQRKRSAERNDVKQQLRLLQVQEKSEQRNLARENNERSLLDSKPRSRPRERDEPHDPRKQSELLDPRIRDFSFSERQNSDDSWEPVRRTPSGEENVSTHLSDFDGSPREIANVQRKFVYAKAECPIEPIVDYNTSSKTKDLPLGWASEKTRQEPDGAPNPTQFVRKESSEFRREVIAASKSRAGNKDSGFRTGNPAPRVVDVTPQDKTKKAIDNLLSKRPEQKKSDITTKLGIPLSMNPRRDPSPDRKKSIYRQLSELVEEDDKSSRAPSQISGPPRDRSFFSQDSDFHSRSSDPSQSISPPNSGSGRSRKIRDLKNKPRRLTQELSEYREDNRRDYKDFLGRSYLDYGQKRHYPPSYISGSSSGQRSHLSDSVTISPPPSGNSSIESTRSPVPVDNYRWSFAHGASKRRPSDLYSANQRPPSNMGNQYPQSSGYRSVAYGPEPISSMH